MTPKKPTLHRHAPPEPQTSGPTCESCGHPREAHEGGAGKCSVDECECTQFATPPPDRADDDGPSDDDE
jgi:hypothetical protein